MNYRNEQPPPPSPSGNDVYAPEPAALQRAPQQRVVCKVFSSTAPKSHVSNPMSEHAAIKHYKELSQREFLVGLTHKERAMVNQLRLLKPRLGGLSKARLGRRLRRLVGSLVGR